MSKHYNSTMTVKKGVVCNPTLELMDYARQAAIHTLRTTGIHERIFTAVGLGTFATMIETPEGEVAVEVQVTPKKHHPGCNGDHWNPLEPYDLAKMAEYWARTKECRREGGIDRLRRLERKIAEMETERDRLAKLFGR